VPAECRMNRQSGGAVQSDNAAPGPYEDPGSATPGQYAYGPVWRDAPAPDAALPTLTFPDLPRLELDQLLGQLVDRAQEVMATQGRLRGLLRANQLIVGDLALPTVLRRIAEAARELVGSQYAALGVISPTGGLSEFVHTGMPDDTVARIGHLPQGKGLLGALIDDPKPIRLYRISDDERSSGFPPGHPPMNTFLGVPIRIRDEVFGNLYFTESTRGHFSAEDEDLATALAVTAAVAIDNARLYSSARSRGEWLQASAAITRQLLTPDPGDGVTSPLRLIAERSREIADADLVTVALPNGDDGTGEVELRIELAVGAGAADLAGAAVPRAGSLQGRVFGSGEPTRLAQAGDEGAAAMTAGGLEIGPALVVPLLGSRGVQGVLTAARLRGRTAFTVADVEMATSFANHAALAIELADARAEQQRAAMLDERDRIAADLHDHVIQRLFAAGLSLQSVAMKLGHGPVSDRILSTIQDLDATISQIRTSIFELHDLPRADPAGLRARLLDVASDAARALGFEPVVRFEGPVDTLPGDLAEDLVAVAREALSNVARHARAGTAEIEVSARGAQVCLAVHDDGIGLSPGSRSSGLTNMRRRAKRHGGILDVAARVPHGTTVTWSIPHL
jgi:signal transduction histidine kinase